MSRGNDSPAMVFDQARCAPYIPRMGFTQGEHWLKRAGFRWIGQSAPRPFSRPTGADLRNVRKILVIRLDDRIGNAVLITPLLISLKNAFSKACVHCLISKRLSGLAEFLPSVDQYIWYDKRSYARNPLLLWGLVRRLRNEEFDLVIDASDELELSFNHAVTTAYSGGRFRVGYDRRGSARWLDVPVPPGDPTRHAVDMHLDLLRALVPVEFAPRPLMDTSRVNSFGAEFRTRHALTPGEPLVIIHPGGRGPKRWPLPRFLNLAQDIVDRLSARPVFIWGPAEESLVNTARAGAHPGVLWAGILSFADLISLLRTAAAYLSNDNGIMHLASGCGVPTIGIFVVSNAAKYRPLGVLDCAFDESIAPVRNEDIIDALRGVIGSTVTESTVGTLRNVEGKNAPGSQSRN